MNKFTFVTSNKNKAREITEILSSGIKINEVELPEIQSLNLDEVIAAKARAAYRKIKKPVLVEDISFEIKALKGLPGTFIKFFLQTLGTEGTVKLVGRSKTDTTVTAAIAIYDGKNFKIFKGKVSGTLSKKDKGIHGFGFDKVFIPKGYKHTYAQMPPSLKNEISHRAKALRKAKTYLKKTN
ncbi:hypothetical protein A3A49_01415 [Candidatus Curtissbacteria bacterium RIFCSPLOWO2_01_FULL_38_11b]|uniref:Non-canonical purine NTP pyrophosphatase, RdgB/HAM1 family n=1 Tax=Candidatus Curtissbacteria bacterium RIFCSPLOWO2_01_FULL_38_11b TaxID=1797725 RepID=A0A1F5H2Q4_9BACT|nr:MAG: hypothetical protein A3A49_01415 [Candidatus Curtissbacteria bacterium RIFCSPLOWO2_01_FULL_38_11b]